jgi:hypothetical protein
MTGPAPQVIGWPGVNDSFGISGISEYVVPRAQVSGGGPLTWVAGGREGRI